MPACLALIGYLFYKSKRRAEGGDTIELRERESLDREAGFTAREPVEEHYQRTPDYVTEQAGQEPLYGRTPHLVVE